MAYYIQYHKGDPNTSYCEHVNADNAEQASQIAQQKAGPEGVVIEASHHPLVTLME